MICKRKNTYKAYASYPGYVEGTSFDIFACRSCGSHFISTKNSSPAIYDDVYFNMNTPGYRIYYGQAKKIKRSKNPLKFLSGYDEKYCMIFKYLTELLKNKPSLRILDVGCGYGSLTYALNCMGHKTLGIDTSKIAIDFAKDNFSSFKDCFMKADANSFVKKNNMKFDLIIALELIEHLPDPAKFIKGCFGILNEDGKMIITTPNKDYYKKVSFWQTDLPPVHISWLSHKGVISLSDVCRLNYGFFDSSSCVFIRENKLTNYIFTRKEKIPLPTITQTNTGYALVVKNKKSALRIVGKQFLFYFTPLRYLFNIVYDLLIKKSPTIGIVLWKKEQ